MSGAAVAGMGALVVQYYRTDDNTERDLLRSIMAKGIEFAGDTRDDLARRIILELDRAMSGKSKKK